MVLILVRFAVAVLLDAYREVMDEHRDRWPVSFPPLEALAKDVAMWWEEWRLKRAGKAKTRPFGGSVAASGVAHTLSGVPTCMCQFSCLLYWYKSTNTAASGVAHTLSGVPTCVCQFACLLYCYQSTSTDAEALRW